MTQGRDSFPFCSAIVLFVAGAILIVTAVEGGCVLDLPDALLGISIRQAYWLMGGALLGGSLLVLLVWRSRVQLAVVGWLSGNMLLYHGGLWWIDGADLFSCLANMAPGFPLSPRVAPALIVLTWALLGVGAGGLLWAADLPGSEKSELGSG